MSATVRMHEGSYLTFETITVQIGGKPVKRVVMEVCGSVHGDVKTIVCIPVDAVPAVIGSLNLCASQVRP